MGATAAWTEKMVGMDVVCIKISNKTRNSKNQRFKNWNRDRKKSNETRLKIMLRIHLIISLSCILNTHQQICYPMHTTEIPILTLHMGNSVPHISSFMNKVCIT